MALDDVALDMSGVGNDRIYLHGYISEPGISMISLQFENPGGPSSYQSWPVAGQSGAIQLSARLRDFEDIGSFNWADVDGVTLSACPRSSTATICFDDLRVGQVVAETVIYLPVVTK